jgi:hypothetical protein
MSSARWRVFLGLERSAGYREAVVLGLPFRSLSYLNERVHLSIRRD